MTLTELAPGLWRWTAVHPEAVTEPEPGGPADWGPEVGSVAWLPDVRTLVTGDRLLGDDDGGVRVCPDSWLRFLDGGTDGTRLRVLLGPLLDLPVERILTAHGEPVLERGREALARALG